MTRSVAPDGTYSSPISSVGARFGTMVGGLTTGRMLIGQVGSRCISGHCVSCYCFMIVTRFEPPVLGNVKQGPLPVRCMAKKISLSSCRARLTRARSASPSRPATPHRVRSSMTSWRVFHCTAAQLSTVPHVFPRCMCFQTSCGVFLSCCCVKIAQVLEYLTHQRRLFPAIATTYAMHLSMDRLKVCNSGTTWLVWSDARLQYVVGRAEHERAQGLS